MPFASPEARRTWARGYWLREHDRVVAHSRKYREKNREKVMAKARAWRAANKARHAAHARLWYLRRKPELTEAEVKECGQIIWKYPKRRENIFSKS